MKKINYILMALVAMLATGCDKDGDILTTKGADAVTVDGSGDIVLTYENSGALALTLYWNDNGTLALSNPLVEAPKNATTNTVQFSDTQDFERTSDIICDQGQFSIQLTAAQLNSAIAKVGFIEAVSKPLYIRIKSTLGANISPTYSNTLVVNVTPYVIDMSVGFILDSNKAETGNTLASPASDGIYKGFMGVSGWYNWYLREGDGTTWGNTGVEGSEFHISSDDSKWNFWFPGVEGCYYVIVDTNKEEWSALLIPSLTVTGALEGEMTFNRKQNTWTLTCNAASAGNGKIKISGTGKQYNVNTKCVDDDAIETPVGFGSTGDAITFGNDAGEISINIPATGEVTLTLNLSDPNAWNCDVQQGAGEPVEEVAKYLYLVGIDDGISGSWTFDNTIKLYNEDDLNYAALCNVNSLWGYQIATEEGNWSSVYTMAEGDAESGTLEMAGSTNIPAPTPGLYLINASLKYLTYNTMAVNGVQYTGINDNWDLHEMTATSTPGVYTAEIDVTAASSWGFQIILNQDWGQKFGGSNGELYYQGANITDDAALAGNTCILTVDLCKCTYTMTVK
ncbi:MAG: DUF5114 domain-containing protein [Muribaculaceae bacterium]